MNTLPYENLLNKKHIWNIRQNKPTLIAKDLELYGVPRTTTHKILLARGVYKWLAVRRKLIKLKNKWKTRITEINKKLATRSITPLERAKLATELNTLQSCRASVRDLCHSERWTAPDFDLEAKKFLESLTD